MPGCLKRIIFTVTNDLNFDRRMQRICGSLAENGYSVTIIGHRGKNAPLLSPRSYQQKRLSTFFRKGPGFYAEFNLRLFLYLLFTKCDALCCIDMDTMPAARFASVLRRKKIVYDAHEYFSEMKEVISRPRVHRVWRKLEDFFVPKIRSGYTVSSAIANEFRSLYGVYYEVIRNVPLLSKSDSANVSDNIIIYQGAVNEARGLENLVPAMRNIDAVLHIYGDGNLFPQMTGFIAAHQLTEKVILHGMVTPEKLNTITRSARIGVNLVENIGKNQYFSLANKFFDYIMNGVPQVTMNFPEYAAVNQQFEVAVLIDSTDSREITAAINRLLSDGELYSRLKTNCARAALEYNWQNEEKKLLRFYKNVL